MRTDASEVARDRARVALPGLEDDTMGSFRARTLVWIATGLTIGGLLVGGAWAGGLFGTAARLVSAQETAPAAGAPTPTAPTTEVPASTASTTAAPATTAAKPARPNANNARRPAGIVTQIASDPAAFTIQTADGTLLTYRVLDATVFMAGRDRPYRFDLLKVGDDVLVRGAGPGNGPNGTTASASPEPGAAPKPKANGPRQNGASAEPVARQVTIRPAGEAGKGKNQRGATAPAATPQRGNHATGQ